MKRLFLVAGLFFTMGRLTLAQDISPTFTYSAAVSSITTTIVNVSSNPAVIIDSPTLYGRAAMEIQNIDTTSNLWCVPNSSPSVNGGRKITPGNSWIISAIDSVRSNLNNVASYAIHIWCVTDGAAATKAAVSQAY